VILEGMAAGVPVIAAGAGGPAEILEHGRTGMLYEPNDGPALAGCMRSLLNPSLRERLSAAARHEVRRYEPQVVAAELHRLYAAVSAPPAARA
jgi:phosphatidylinositol alpha 1,6-mannosyltransferase